jgi:hypothetical protein
MFHKGHGVVGEKRSRYRAVEILATWMIKPGMTALYVYAETNPEMND